MESVIINRTPPEGFLSHRTALLDIFCRIDVIDEIQSENDIVIDVFDDVFTIEALFEYDKMSNCTVVLLKPIQRSTEV